MLEQLLRDGIIVRRIERCSSKGVGSRAIRQKCPKNLVSPSDTPRYFRVTASSILFKLDPSVQRRVPAKKEDGGKKIRAEEDSAVGQNRKSRGNTAWKAVKRVPAVHFQVFYARTVKSDAAWPLEKLQGRQM